MSVRWWSSLMVVATVWTVPASAQQDAALPTSASALRYADPSTGISLADAIRRALEREPSLQAVRASVDVARGLRTQAALRPNPAISFEQRSEPAGMDRQTGISVQWPLDLFRKTGRTSVSDREIDVATLGVEDRERLLAAEVRQRYGEVLVAVRELVILDDLVTTTTRQWDLLRARVDEGASPPIDRDLVDVELRRLEADRAVQAGRADVALIGLKRIIGLPPATPLKVRDSLEAAVASFELPISVPTAIPDRPDVRQAEARIGAADARIDQIRREARVDASVFGSYMRMTRGFPPAGVVTDGTVDSIRLMTTNIAVGAMVTVPIVNRNQGQLAAARAARIAAAAEYDATRLTAEAELAAAEASAAQATAAVALYRDRAGALARRNLSVVAQSYDLGRVTVFDVLLEQRRFFDVERAYTDALRAAYEAHTALVRAMGGVQ